MRHNPPCYGRSPIPRGRRPNVDRPRPFRRCIRLITSRVIDAMHANLQSSLRARRMRCVCGAKCSTLPIKEIEMNAHTDLIDRYFDSWNETDGVRRRELIEATWSADADYRDPLLAGTGHAGIDAMIRAVHERFP